MPRHSERCRVTVYVRGLDCLRRKRKRKGNGKARPKMGWPCNAGKRQTHFFEPLEMDTMRDSYPRKETVIYTICVDETIDGR